MVSGAHVCVVPMRHFHLTQNMSNCHIDGPGEYYPAAKHILTVSLSSLGWFSATHLGLWWFGCDGAGWFGSKIKIQKAGELLFTR